MDCSDSSCRWIGPLNPFREAFSIVLDDIASVTLQTAISGLGERQRVTANNIANVETPGFTASNVNFESSLAEAVAAGDPTRTVVTTTAYPGAAGINGNNVSLDAEVVTATETGLQEKLLTGAITSKYGFISTVLKG